MKEIVLIREVTTEECPWLNEDIPEGTVLYEYSGYTYGCITDRGIAVSKEPDQSPFFEIPYSATIPPKSGYPILKMLAPPVVGEKASGPVINDCRFPDPDSLGVFIWTSPVVSIDGNTFTTKNTTYEWELLEK